ncbi:hypothetical protein HJFPF1_05705 [Paramyrothecium foliicola]|nr:hypothetical protein HJFPF1_05705 [Paramyrothecium foliicola]
MSPLTQSVLNRACPLPARPHAVQPPNRAMAENKSSTEQLGAVADTCCAPAPGRKPKPFSSTADPGRFRAKLFYLANCCVAVVAFVGLAINKNELLNPPIPVRSHGKTQRASRPRNPYNSSKRKGSGKGAKTGKATGHSNDTVGGTEDEDDADNGRDLPQPKSDPQDKTTGHSKFFACPFFKLNPIRHVNCFMRNRLTTVPFVVQHLMRDHVRPLIYCPVCNEIFDERELCDVHIRRRMCEPRDVFHEGLTEDQVKQLRESRRSYTVEERWYLVFEIVCPGVTRPDSPYLNSPFEELLGIIRRIWQFVGATVHNPLIAVYSRDALVPPDMPQDARFIDGTEASFWNWTYLTSNLPVAEDLSFLTSDLPYPRYSRAATEGIITEASHSQPFQQHSLPFQSANSFARPNYDGGDGSTARHLPEQSSLPPQPSAIGSETRMAEDFDDAYPHSTLQGALSPLSRFLIPTDAEQTTTNQVTETNPSVAEGSLADTDPGYPWRSATPGDHELNDDDYDDDDKFDYSKFLSG